MNEKLTSSRKFQKMGADLLDLQDRIRELEQQNEQLKESITEIRGMMEQQTSFLTDSGMDFDQLLGTNEVTPVEEAGHDMEKLMYRKPNSKKEIH